MQDNGIRGWLAFESLPNDLQLREDSTQAADQERWQAGYVDGRRSVDGLRWQMVRTVVPNARETGVDPTPEHVWVFERVATPTERVLLQHLGYELPADLATRVTWFGAARNRRWPQLESETTE